MDKIKINDKNLDIKKQKIDYDADFTKIINHFIDKDIASFGTMDNKTRSIVTLVCITSIQTLKSIRNKTREALNLGVTVVEIKEALYQAAPYIGFTRVLEALDEVNAELISQGIEPIVESESTVDENTRFDKGLALQQQIFGEDNINNMRASASDEIKHIQDYLSANCFGDYYTRSTLDLKMRELITFVVICSIGGCEQQAKAHVMANISVGNNKQTLIEAITQCTAYIGYPRTLNALNCINEICK